MSKRKVNDSLTGENVVDYRHKNVTRLNIPPAGLAARGQIARETVKVINHYGDEVLKVYEVK